MIRSKKIKESARGESCTMGSPKCNGNPETVVWCHSNFHEHGKGVGHKADDIFGFYGCSGCHQWFDVDAKAKKWEKQDRRFYFLRAHAKSLLILIDKGIVKVA